MTRNWDARKVFGLSLVLIFIFISFVLSFFLFFLSSHFSLSWLFCLDITIVQVDAGCLEQTVTIMEGESSEHLAAPLTPCTFARNQGEMEPSGVCLPCGM